MLFYDMLLTKENGTSTRKQTNFSVAYKNNSLQFFKNFLQQVEKLMEIIILNNNTFFLTCEYNKSSIMNKF